MSLKQRKWDGSLWMSRNQIMKDCRRNAGFFVCNMKGIRGKIYK